MEKLKSRKLGYVFVMMLILSISMMFSGMQASAASKKEKKAYKAYKQLLSKSRVEVLKKGSWFLNSKYKQKRIVTMTPSKYITFQLIYLDNDSVPELVVRDIKRNAFALYRFKKNKAVKVAQGSRGSKGGDVPCYYYSGTGLLYVRDSVAAKVYVYYYNGKKLTPKYVWYQKGQSLNGTNHYRNPIKGKRNSYADGTWISEKTYLKEITSYGSNTYVKDRVYIESSSSSMFANTKVYRNAVFSL